MGGTGADLLLDERQFRRHRILRVPVTCVVMFIVADGTGEEVRARTRSWNITQNQEEEVPKSGLTDFSGHGL